MKAPKDRNLFFYEQFTQDSVKKLTESILEIIESDQLLKKQAELNSLTYNPPPIKIYIDSFGGSVYSCLGLISVIEKSPTEIHTICTGSAMSCGFLLLISGHKRFCYKRSTMMDHSMSTHLWGDIKTIEEDLGQTHKLEDICNEFILEKTLITKSKLKKIRNKKKDWYFDAEKALKYGVIDEIL